MIPVLMYKSSISPVTFLKLSYLQFVRYIMYTHAHTHTHAHTYTHTRTHTHTCTHTHAHTCRNTKTSVIAIMRLAVRSSRLLGNFIAIDISGFNVTMSARNLVSVIRQNFTEILKFFNDDLNALYDLYRIVVVI